MSFLFPIAPEGDWSDDDLEARFYHYAWWYRRGLAALCTLRGTVATAEAIRLRLVALGLPEPSHHNHWGTLFLEAKRVQLVRPTGERRPMETARSHGRYTDVYEVIG